MKMINKAEMQEATESGSSHLYEETGKNKKCGGIIGFLWII
jgi:hypothetical protein